MTRSKTPLTLDPAVLGALLDGAWAAERRRGRARVAHPDAIPPVTGDLDELRAATLRGVKALAESGATFRSLPEELGGANDHAGYVAAFEEAVTASPACRSRPGCSSACSAVRSSTSATPSSTRSGSCPPSAPSSSAASR